MELQDITQPLAATVDHDELMATRHGRRMYSGSKITVLRLRWNPNGSGIFAPPGTGEVLRASRDPETKKIKSDEDMFFACYERDVPAIMEWCETNGVEIESARLAAKRSLATWMRSKLDRGAHLDEDPAQWTPEQKALAQKYTGNTVESLASEILGEREGRKGRLFGILPLSVCEIVSEGIQAPKSAQLEQIEQLAAKSGGAEVLAGIRELIAEMRRDRTSDETNDELEKLRKANEGLQAKLRAAEERAAAKKG